MPDTTIFAASNMYRTEVTVDEIKGFGRAEDADFGHFRVTMVTRGHTPSVGRSFWASRSKALNLAMYLAS